MHPMQGMEQEARQTAVVVSKNVFFPRFLCDSLKTHQAEFLHSALMEIQGNLRHFDLKILVNV